MPGLTKVQKALEEVKADAIAVQTRRIEDWRRDNPEAAAELDARLAEGLEITKAKADDSTDEVATKKATKKETE